MPGYFIVMLFFILSADILSLQKTHPASSYKTYRILIVSARTQNAVRIHNEKYPVEYCGLHTLAYDYAILGFLSSVE